MKPFNRSTPSFYANYKQWGIILAGFLLIAFLFQKTLHPLIDNRAQILEEALYINKLEDTILQTITLSQVQEIQQFDVLNKQSNILKSILNKFKQNPGIQSSEQLTQQVTNLIQLAEQQAHLINQFKTNHSVLQNSWSYFPTAFELCSQDITKLGSPHNTPDIKLLLQNTLISGVMIMQNLNSDKILDLTRQVSALERLNLASPKCQNFIGHGRLLINYTPNERIIHHRLFELNLSKAVHELYAQIEFTTSKAIEDNKTIYLMISTFTILLLFYIGFTLTRLYRSNITLTKTLADLSQQQVMFKALIKANSAILQAKDKATLYQQICEITTHKSLFESCWIGEINQDETISIASYAGDSPELFNNLSLSVRQDSNVQGAVYQCYHTQAPFITNDFSYFAQKLPKESLLKDFKIEGVAALPITVKGQVIAVFVVYTRKVNFFNEVNKALLHQLANDISLSLQRFNFADEQRQHQQDLAIASMAFETHEAIIITNASSNIIRTNQAFTTLTGYTAEEVIGKTPNLLKSGLHNTKFYKELWRTVNTTGVWQGEIWNRKKDGSLYPTWQNISAIHDIDQQITHYISHALDLTQDKEAQRQIHYLNNHDSLTKLPNRRLLIDQLDHRLSQPKPYYSLLFLVNINRFKLLNNSLGHAAGDQLLIKVAERLINFDQETLDSTTVARVGNDEFTLLCTSQIESEALALQAAENIGHQLQNKLSETVYIQDQEVVIDTSIGVTLFTPCQKTPEMIIQETSTALARAKQTASQGAQNIIQFFEPSMQAQAQKRLTLENELRHALAHKEFVLHYQPQINIKTGLVIGIESLIRWQKSTSELIPPFQFISILEESSLIIPVGLWILEEAITQAKILHSLQPDLIVSVNLSAIQFNDAQLIPKIEQMLIDLNFPAALLELEVTESLLMHDIDQSIKKLDTLAALGIKIAIDDFGTGYSSLAYLKKFPVSKLKIDKAFIDDLASPNSSDAGIVKATIQMAHALNITSIAEGVESQEQVDILKAMQCQEIQGYFYSKPLPAHELVQFIKNSAPPPTS